MSISYAYTDILITGGGVAGLEAALEAGRSGAKVLLLEQSPHFGGRFMVDDVEVDGRDGPAYIAHLLAEIAKLPNVTLRARTQGAGVFDHGYALGYERLTDHAPAATPRHRLWRIRAKRIITATGALERTLNFAGNDIPGVMLAGAVRDYIRLYGVAPGARTVVVTNNDDAYRTALTLHAAGLEIPAIIDARANGGGELAAQARALGIRIETGHAVAKVTGKKHVTGVEICLQAAPVARLKAFRAIAWLYQAAFPLWFIFGPIAVAS